MMACQVENTPCYNELSKTLAIALPSVTVWVDGSIPFLVSGLMHWIFLICVAIFKVFSDSYLN